MAIWKGSLKVLSSYTQQCTPPPLYDGSALHKPPEEEETLALVYLFFISYKVLSYDVCIHLFVIYSLLECKLSEVSVFVSHVHKHTIMKCRT